MCLYDGDDDDDVGEERVDQRVSTRVIFTQSSTMPRRACSPCYCRPCTRAAQPLLLLPPRIRANMPLIPGLSDSPSPNPHYHPPSDGASAPFEADENGVGSSSFSLSQAACLLLPASLVGDEHAPRLGHACRFSARTLHAALPPLRCHRCTAKASKAAEYFPVTHPPSNRSRLFDRKMRSWHRGPQTQRHVLSRAEDTPSTGLVKCSRKNFRR